jgi:hypothetical protein
VAGVNNNISFLYKSLTILGEVVFLMVFMGETAHTPRFPAHFVKEFTWVVAIGDPVRRLAVG